MPWIRLRARGRMGKGRIVGRRRLVGRGGMRAARARLAYRSRPTPVFTESFVGPSITYGGAGVNAQVQLIQNNLGQIPQVADYTALYNQYQIRRVTAIFVPAYDTFQIGSPTGATGTTCPRMVYAIQDSAQQLNPTTEADVLQDNGAKIRMFDKPVKISWRPVAAAADALVQGGFASVNRKYQWYGTTSTAVQHNGLALAFTTALAPAGNPTLANVYYKITFALKDPK